MNKPSIIDLLVRSEYDPAVLPEKVVEIKRLSDIIGEPFTLRVRGLSGNELENLRKHDNGDLTERAVLAGTLEPSLTSLALTERFKCSTPLEALRKLFLPGEISGVFNVIYELSGYGGVSDVVRDVRKN